MKGLTLQDLSSYSITFITVAIVLSIGATILLSIQTTQYISTSISNESRDFASSDTYYDLQGSGCCAVGYTTCSAMYDDADHTNTYLNTSQYTCSDTQIKIYVNGTGGYPNMTTGTHYYDYGYNNPYSTASNATGYGLTGTSTMSQWLPIIAVIIAAAIVIGIIIKSFS